MSGRIVAFVLDLIRGKGGLQYLLGDKPLLGLFVPSPQWPVPVDDSRALEKLLSKGMIRLAFLSLVAVHILIAFVMYICIVPYWLLLMLFLPPVTFAGYHKVSSTVAARTSSAEEAEIEDWRAEHAAYFSTSSETSRLRRRKCAEGVLERVQPKQAKKFNEYVSNAKGLAVYGCGILAAAHVGGLRALERHGLQYKNIKTLAGVSAGSVVVAMISVGYNAEELFKLITELPFYKLGMPELGAIMRTMGNLLQTLVRKLAGESWASFLNALAGGSGAGLNSGLALEEMIGEALKAKCGNADITLGEIQKKYGKRVVIMVTELDSGHERLLTPEDDPDLPIRIAVRMSMGVPGLMEPFAYQNHVYCDGGMCNDFPLNAIPKDGRLGLMIRPTNWIEYNMGGTERLIEVVGEEEFNTSPALKKELEEIDHNIKKGTGGGVYPVSDGVDLMTTCCTVMMDANLMLQLQRATHEFGVKFNRMGLSELAPTILTLCGGTLNPFDFNLTVDQHRDLYYSGQLCTHLHASSVDESTEVMANEDKMKTLLFCYHNNYPSTPATSQPAAGTSTTTTAAAVANGVAQQKNGAHAKKSKVDKKKTK
eukprot:TRINITY_DN62717_c0_g1_i1.p1 TRINITY_DN62717_c0_g1~~TRINITY_DN62717_c0_g1_i1.p1  ORF type:complete len:607 (+),score=154.79 TRINITY_DN62717_c0_g1_i1:41-1822(+)